ncbi:hypothetical protein ACEUZ9_002610 [Paracoccus litorisediminis]|uniref:hypothetical protein n=1 Tax=Paracoccus litorisediminis TaxID=2006130 RepID=UPI003730D015
MVDFRGGFHPFLLRIRPISSLAREYRPERVENKLYVMEAPIWTIFRAIYNFCRICDFPPPWAHLAGRKGFPYIFIII